MKNHNQAKHQNDQLKVSSHDIAAVTGKQHKHVMRDIRNMLAELGESSAPYVSTYRDRLGRHQPCYELDEALSLTLVTGYTRGHVVNFMSWLDKTKAARAYTDTQQIETNRAGQQQMVPLSNIVDLLVKIARSTREEMNSLLSLITGLQGSVANLQECVKAQQKCNTRLGQKLEAIDARIEAATVYMTIERYLTVFASDLRRINDEEFAYLEDELAGLADYEGINPLRYSDLSYKPAKERLEYPVGLISDVIRYSEWQYHAEDDEPTTRH